MKGENNNGPSVDVFVWKIMFGFESDLSLRRWQDKMNEETGFNKSCFLFSSFYVGLSVLICLHL